jgi:hypothetical protein
MDDMMDDMAYVERISRMRFYDVNRTFSKCVA